MGNVYLYNVDDLQSIADDYLKQRKEEVERCEAIIRDKAQTLLGQFGRRDSGGYVARESITHHAPRTTP